MSGGLARRLRLMSPRHRRWQQLLDSCSLDPDSLSDPIESPGAGDFIICGHSRSGTALATAALWDPPRVVTVMEPWDSFRLPPAELFQSVRNELAHTARLARGRLDIEQLELVQRVVWQRDGASSIPLPITDDYLLGIKMPSFWRYLDRLPDTKFVVCLRDPTEVVDSYRRVGGRLTEGLDYDIPFNRTMNRHLESFTGDVKRRRVEMFDYVAEAVLPHIARPNVYVLRYERWLTEPQQQLNDLLQFLGAPEHELRVKISAGERAARDSVQDVRRWSRTAEALDYGDPALSSDPMSAEGLGE